MSDDDLLEELLLDWEDHADAGTLMAPEALCPADRPALLPRLKAEIAKLQRMRQLDHSAAETPASPKTDSTLPPEAEHFADRRYDPTRFHARGGLGAVFVAKDHELNRRVALKLLRADRSTDASRQRFIREALLTGRLEHPGVVPVYSSGIDERGEPYYAMRFIKGESLRQALEAFHAATLSESERNKTLRGLLMRFVSACQTVAYAHSRGVIHRDLKPDNIMLGKFGETLVVDWGLARRVTESSFGEESLIEPASAPAEAELTRPGMALGTPAYMSPEQARGDTVLGPACDIFGLGATLYCILTGRSPYTGNTALDDAKRAHFPPPRRVRPDIPRPLEAIALKAMAAEPPARYASGAELATDIDNWLAGEAVTAWAEPWYVRGGRALRRRRTLVVASVVFLFLAIIGTTWQAIRATRAEKETADQLVQTSLQKRQAEDNEAKAVAANEETKLALAELTNASELVFDVFEGFDIWKVKEAGEPVEAVLADRLVAAAERLTPETIRDPLVRAQLQNRLGNTLLSLGRAKEAIPLFEQARKTWAELRGLDHTSTLTSMNNLASSYQKAGEVIKALPIYEETLTLRKALLGPDHPNTFTSMNNLAEAYRAASQLDKAVELHEQTQALLKAKLGPEDQATLTSMNNLAAAYQDSGQAVKALHLYEKVLALRKAKFGPEHPLTLNSMSNLAGAYRDNGQITKAIPLFEETQALLKAKLGSEHPITLFEMQGLALSYMAAGQVAKALAMYEQTLALRKVTLGPKHPDTLNSMNNLADAYRAMGQLDKALPLHEQTLALRKVILGPEHRDTLSSMNNLATSYQANNQLDKALPLCEGTLALMKTTLGPAHPSTFTSMNNLAEAYRAMGQLDKALPLHEQTLALRKNKLGPEHRDTLISMHNLALCYKLTNQLDKAIPLHEQTLVLMKKVLGAEHQTTLTCMANMADSYLAAGQMAKALELCEKTMELRKDTLGSEHPDTLKIMHNLAHCYKLAGQLDKSLPLYEATLALMKRVFGPHHRNTLTCMNGLAMGYHAARQPAKAVPLFEEVLALSKTTLGPEHLDTLVSMNNLGRAYCAAKQGDKAAPLLKEYAASRRKLSPKDDLNFAGLLSSLGFDLLKCEQYAVAEEMLRECLAIRESKQPDSSQTFHTQSLLGGTLLGQKKYSDAEPLLVKGYEGLKAREKLIPASSVQRIPDALDRLIAIYTAMNKLDEVKKYQELRAKYPTVKETAPPAKK